jgi:hypothetical protein
MWCPKCEAEFVKGIEECPRCLVRLIDHCPKQDEYKELLETDNSVDVSLIKDILDSNGINYYFKGELFNVVQPWTDPSRLMIREDHLERARTLLRDVKLQYWNVPTTKDAQKFDARSQQ